MATRLIVFIVLFSSLVTLVLTGFQLYGEYNRDVSTIRSRMVEIERGYLNSVRENLWLLDGDRLSTLVRGIATLPDIARVSVRTAEGLVIAEAGDSDGKDAISKSYRLQYETRGNTIPLGEFTVVASLKGARWRVVERAGIILLSNGLKTAFVVAFIYFLFHRLVARHLEDAARYARNFSLDDPPAPLRLDRHPVPGRHDEMDDLTLAINQMNERLKQNYRAIKTGEERYRGLVESAPYCIVELDAAGRIQSMNPISRHFLGVETDTDALGKCCQDFMSDEDASAMKRNLERALRGEPAEFEVEIQSASGPRCTVINLVRLPVEEGSEARVMAISHDVTERRMREAEIQQLNADLERRVDERTHELRTAKEQAEEYLAIAGTGIIALDGDGRVILINRRGCEMLGGTEREILGRDWFSNFIPEEQSEEVKQVFGQILAGNIESVATYENEVVTRSGERRLVAWYNSYLKDEEGNIIGCLSSGEDITDRRRGEMELARTHRKLLNQERLAALGQLTGVVAHELRNPLGTISTSIGILRRSTDADPDRIDTALERAERNIERCDRIITELLDYTRTGNVEPAVQPFDRWLSQTLDELEPPVGVTLRRSLDTDDTAVRFDDQQMRRVLVNLFDNACQAICGQGENATGTLTVSTRIRGKILEIEVRDDGPGIPAAIREQVFEPLFSTKSFGVGLGLPIVKRIVEEHDGVLRIESEECGGTAVIVGLPMARAPLPETTGSAVA